MKNHVKSIICLLTLSVIILGSCNYQDYESNNKFVSDYEDGHNSMNSLDWDGVYTGILPCADCEGIETTITLFKNLTFTKSAKYLGKEGKFFEKGRFAWIEDGAKISAITEDGKNQMYLVGENVLFHLDKEGNRIGGDLADMYALNKNRMDFRIEGKKWFLVKLNGRKIVIKDGNKIPFLLLDASVSTFSGNGSCNNISGSYKLKGNNRISFGLVRSTLMACPEMKTEKHFAEVLSKADNYSVSDSTLTLNKARMAPLAEFRLEK